ncbi:hypothetical protein ACQ4PT_054739 [Festuca glaucescens]
MARNPLFTVPFDLTSSSRDDYGAFIAGIRARLGNPRHVSHGRPVLPPVESGIPPRRWFHVVLKTPASALTLATRADNLDLAGFQSSDGTWWELSDGRKRGAMVCVMRGPRGLIPGSSSLGFGGTYRDLAGGAREAIDFTVGWQQMTEAVDALAAHTEEADIAPSGAERQALVVLRYMVHEATRFLDVSAAVAGLMRSPDAGTTKSIKLTLKGGEEDLGWQWSSSLLLSADSLSGRSRGDYCTYPAAWEIGDCLARAVARVGILLFVATENGIKAKRVLRLFDGDLCRRAGTDGGAATVDAKADVRFLVSGVSVAAHRFKVPKGEAADDFADDSEDGMDTDESSKKKRKKKPANLVHQVFYIVDPRNKKRHVVMSSKRSIIGVDGVISEEGYNNIDDTSGPSCSFDVRDKDEVLPESPHIRNQCL